MELNELLNEITRKLQGHVAVVQIFVDGEVHVRRVGDANRLIDNPSLIPPSSTLSFLEWMRQQIDEANVTSGTRSNHRNCLKHLAAFREDVTFADLDYRLVCAETLGQHNSQAHEGVAPLHKHRHQRRFAHC